MEQTVFKAIHDMGRWVNISAILPCRRRIKEASRDVAFGDHHQETHPSTGPGVASDDIQSSPSASNKVPEPDYRAVGARSRIHYHVILVREIENITKDFTRSPDREYTFNEWVWYLKLIAQDESSPQNHREPSRWPKVYGKAARPRWPGGEDETAGKWSWLGMRSPLMESTSEPAWVLEKLLKTLARDMQAMMEEEKEMEGDMAERTRRFRGMEMGQPSRDIAMNIG